MAFAKGDKAWGISDRSGFRYRLKEMKREWNGLLVGPDEFEEKHPQLRAPRATADPQALRESRPSEPETLIVFAGVPTVEAPRLERLRMVAQVGAVEVVTT